MRDHRRLGVFALSGAAARRLRVMLAVLRPRVLNGADKLQPKVYRPETSFQFDDGTYPDRIEYMDFLPLDQLKNANTQAEMNSLSRQIAEMPEGEGKDASKDNFRYMNRFAARLKKGELVIPKISCSEEKTNNEVMRKASK